MEVIQLGYDSAVLLLHPTDPPTTPVEFLIFILGYAQGDGGSKPSPIPVDQGGQESTCGREGTKSLRAEGSRDVYLNPILVVFLITSAGGVVYYFHNYVVGEFAAEGCVHRGLRSFGRVGLRSFARVCVWGEEEIEKIKIRLSGGINRIFLEKNATLHTQ